MSIEVETPEQTSQPSIERPILLPGRPQPPALWRRRRVQFAAIATVLAVIAAFVANNFLVHQYSPEGAVREYLSALQSGDTNSAWSVMQVGTATGQVNESLLDKSALQAALSRIKPDIQSYVIDGTTQVSSSESVVSLTYETKDGSKQAQVDVRRSGQSQFLLYQGWRLMLAPDILDITLPTGGQGVGIDGKSVSLPAGKSKVAVLPVAHQVTFNATTLLEAQTVSVDSLIATEIPVIYQPKLTPAGLAKAQAAVKTAFAACATKTDLSPDGCPQRYSGYVNSPQWQVLGDPTQSMGLAFGQDGSISATGHYQMVISYQEAGLTGTGHDVVAGGFSASLALTPSDVTVTSISSDDKVAPLQRPAAATDQAAKDLVSAAMKRCATLTGLSPADCPQDLFKGYADNVHWQLSGDPLTSASVAFDPATGIYTVKGTFQMNASYSVNGYPSTDTSTYSHYTAYLLWDGQALQLVTIAGGFS